MQTKKGGYRPPLGPKNETAPSDRFSKNGYVCPLCNQVAAAQGSVPSTEFMAIPVCATCFIATDDLRIAGERGNREAMELWWRAEAKIKDYKGDTTKQSVKESFEWARTNW